MIHLLQEPKLRSKRGGMIMSASKRSMGGFHCAFCARKVANEVRLLIATSRRKPLRRIAPNRQLIVNRFHVIINSAAWNLSPIHHQNARTHQRVRRQPGVQLQESSDNHPINSENHRTDSANPSIIYDDSITGDAETRGTMTTRVNLDR